MYAMQLDIIGGVKIGFFVPLIALHCNEPAIIHKCRMQIDKCLYVMTNNKGNLRKLLDYRQSERFTSSSMNEIM